MADMIEHSKFVSMHHMKQEGGYADNYGDC